MPSNKRSREDTWTTDELEYSMKEYRKYQQTSHEKRGDQKQSNKEALGSSTHHKTSNEKSHDRHKQTRNKDKGDIVDGYHPGEKYDEKFTESPREHQREKHEKSHHRKSKHSDRRLEIKDTTRRRSSDELGHEPARIEADKEMLERYKKYGIAYPSEHGSKDKKTRTKHRMYNEESLVDEDTKGRSHHNKTRHHLEERYRGAAVDEGEGLERKGNKEKRRKHERVTREDKILIDQRESQLGENDREGSTHRRIKHERRDSDGSHRHDKQDVSYYTSDNHHRKLEDRKPSNGSITDSHNGHNNTDQLAPEATQKIQSLPTKNDEASLSDHSRHSNNDDVEYDDDFEDYDDDFEDEINDDSDFADDTPDLVEMRKHHPDTPDLQSSRLPESPTRHSRLSTSSSSTARRSVINFSSANIRLRLNKMASKSMRRLRDLQSLIELDFADFNIFELPPINEYDMYIRFYGQSNSRQVSVQTNEDSLDRDSQTDLIDQNDSWCQHPAESSIVSVTSRNNEFTNDFTQNTRFTSTDSAKLSKFVRNAGQLILALLEEDLFHRSAAGALTHQSNLSITSGCVTLGSNASFLGSGACAAIFCSGTTCLLLTVHKNVKIGTAFTFPALISLWQTTQPSFPQKYLLCHSLPTVCTSSPGSSKFVFAGFDDGSISLWDLTESSSLHTSCMLPDNTDVLLRRHTYHTAGMQSVSNHDAPIIDLHVLTSSVNHLSEGTNFQLVSADEFGVINIWVVVELTKEDERSDDSDLCLSVGGRYKLVKITSFSFRNTKPFSELCDSKITCFQCDPSNTNIFWAGTESGSVLRTVRFGNPPTPKRFALHPETPAEVISISISPFKSACFLAGFRDGCVCLFNVKTSRPICQWSPYSEGAVPSSVWFSPTRPALFHVLSDARSILTYDLTENDLTPIVSDVSQADRILHIFFSPPVPASTSHTKPTQMSLVMDDGRVVLYDLTKTFYEQRDLEEEYLLKYLQGT